jgi:hypothetical protein
LKVLVSGVYFVLPLLAFLVELITLLLKISVVDVGYQDNDINDVHDQAQEMLSKGKGPPFVIDQVPDEIRLEDWQLIAACQAFKQGLSIIIINDTWKDVQHVLNLEFFFLIVLR